MIKKENKKKVSKIKEIICFLLGHKIDFFSPDFDDGVNVNYKCERCHKEFNEKKEAIKEIIYGIFYFLAE